jgi:hypothetical protein
MQVILCFHTKGWIEIIYSRIQQMLVPPSPILFLVTNKQLPLGKFIDDKPNTLITIMNGNALWSYKVKVSL